MTVAPLVVGAFLVFGFVFVIQGALPFFQDSLWDNPLVALTQATRATWFPSEGDYGLQALIAGSLAVVVLAAILALPLSFFAALSLTFFLPDRVARPLRGMIELCGGIPAVVVGLFGLLTLLPFLSQFGVTGFGLAAAALVLAILLIPHTIIQMSSVLGAESQDVLLCGDSLGLSRHRSVLHLVVKPRLGSLVQSGILAFARGLGETLAVLMVAGNVIAVPHGLFEPFRTLNATIALEIPYALGTHRASLFVLGLLTFALVWFLRFLSSAPVVCGRIAKRRVT